jgi:hypothetical protein
MHEENAFEMRKQFQSLKRKLALKAQQLYSSTNSSNYQNAVQSKAALPRLELSEIIKMNPQKIDLVKKYRAKIHGKLAVFREAEMISKEKEDYNEWYDSVRNSPLKSPMFNKVPHI